MREQLVKLRLARFAQQDGWVMMDAVWSSVVVVMAFVATFLALENGTSTARRDATRTAAYQVAQEQMSYMRNLGKHDINALLALNNTNAPPTSPSTTVTRDGDSYYVWYSAYYVTGLGNNSTDACGGTYSGNGQGTAKFIYMKVVVAPATTTWSGTTPSTPPATLDEYFAPEGGSSNTATGTLRVYLLKPPSDSPWAGITVSLVATGTGMSFATQTKTTGSSGCVLFTGLPRGAYEIQVTTTKYDIYMQNPTGSLLRQPINLPDRAAMSKDIRMDSPVKVSPEFWVTDTNNQPLQVVPTTSTTAGPPKLVGPWAGRSSQIKSNVGTDFTAPPGTAWMPHMAFASYAQNYMYVDPGGYDIFGGPCDVNAPNTLPHIPTTGNATWVAGGTYMESGAYPKFQYDRFAVDINFDTSDQALYKQRQIKNASPGGVRVQVRLIGKANASSPSSPTSVECGPNASLFNSWVRQKGTMYWPLGATSTTSTPAYKLSLNDDAEALPPGKYDVCMQAYTSQTVRPNIYTAWSGLNEYHYKLLSDVDLDSNQGFTWDPFTDYTTTDCTSGASWSP